MNVVVVGGGVVGCAVAYFLAKRGVRVTVIDRGRMGREASFAAAGILGAQSEMHGASEATRKEYVRARSLVVPWVRELEALSGIRVGYRRSGVLHVALSDHQMEALRVEAETQSSMGLRGDLCDPAACLVHEPALAPNAQLGFHVPDDGTVDPRKLMHALLAALALFDVELREGETVADIAVDAGSGSGRRAMGVVVNGEIARADAVVIAAGAWSSSLPAVRAAEPSLEIIPVRGQIVVLREETPTLRGVVFGAGGYVVPRGDGHVLVGSTEERVGFASGPTAEGVSTLLARARRLVPSLAHSRFVEAWSGLRPQLAGGPRVGPSSLPGLYLATGHFRNGVLLACQTGRDIADEVFPAPSRESVRVSSAGEGS